MDNEYSNIPDSKIKRLEKAPVKNRRVKLAPAKIRHLQKQQKVWTNSKMVYKKK
jgi:hypothetical protein